MEIMQIVGLGLLGAILTVLLRQNFPEFSLQLSLIIGLLIFIFMLNRVIAIIETLKQLARMSGVDLIYLDTILKIIGIAYIAEFGAEICRDANAGIIASKIEFAGKILIISMGLPIMITILESIIELLP